MAQQLVATQQCDGSCHDFEYGLRFCSGCNSAEFGLMCPDCEYYSAQDV